ncbi:hypothetical protein F511_09949 [Dorcoceras hygrometricum]|uniref:Uncharacterized protein n=1 Tax=Dorcoceras hygrometricum TaxID=472368 RepID=A0A2Z7ABW8_9LAMI|nr:hypothetical protein F511_09949 [Dorcoceras hygrometricum]
MGNCQAAEAATVVIQHPGDDKVERIFWPVCANQVMSSNPGHYVALIRENAAGAPLGRQLKLQRPDDILLLGQVYRLISFEDVLKGFAAKKCVKVRKTLQEGGRFDAGEKKTNSNANPRSANSCSMMTEQQDVQSLGDSGRSIIGGGLGRYHASGGQWRPSLQSIAEMGT